MASVGVMSAAASKTAVFTGARTSVRARSVRTAAMPGAAQIAAKSTRALTMTASKQGAVSMVVLQANVAAAARNGAFDVELSAARGSSIVTSAGGAVGPADTVAEDVRFDMTPAGEKKRWAMIFSLFCAFVLCNLDKVNMSVAIVPMAASFGWTSVEKGLVQSAFFWGYAFTQVPGGYLASKYGGKFVLFAGVMLWSFGTLIAPMCANFSFTALLVSRFLVGLGEGVAPSAATGILAKGVPGSQRSKAVTATFGGLDVGSLSGLIIAPPIILFLGGWPAVFYLFGILGFIWGTW
jgi:hypothetical protein